MKTEKTRTEKRAAKAAYMREYWKRNPEKYAAFLAHQVETKASTRTYKRNKDKPEFREKKLEAGRRYYQANRIRLKNKQGARTYGMTEEEFAARKESDCDICAGHVPRGGNGGGMHIDHCHKTGKIRGNLCRRCNLGLGHFNDDPAYLESAIAYLRHWAQVEAGR